MAQTKILPDDPAKAVKHIIGIVDQLLGLLDKESMALLKQDAVSFSAAQQEKATLSQSYQQCSDEFRDRLMEFRSVDKALLDRLDTRQRELAAKSKENMATMDRMGNQAG